MTEAALSPGTNAFVEVTAYIFTGTISRLGVLRLMAREGDQEHVGYHAIVGTPRKTPVSQPFTKLILVVHHRVEGIIVA